MAGVWAVACADFVMWLRFVMYRAMGGDADLRMVGDGRGEMGVIFRGEALQPAQRR